MNAFKNFPATTLLLGLGLLFAHPQSTLAQITTDTQPAPVIAAPKQHDLLATVASYRDDVRQSVLLVSQQPQEPQQVSARAHKSHTHTYCNTNEWLCDLWPKNMGACRRPGEDSWAPAACRGKTKSLLV